MAETQEISKERQGELALICFKHLLKKRGVKLNSQAKRELVSEAKAMGIDPEELSAFLRPILQETLDEMLDLSSEKQDRKKVKEGSMTEEEFQKKHGKPYKK